jgi:hypothetical protein
MPAVRRRDFSQRALAVTRSGRSASIGRWAGFPSNPPMVARTTTFLPSLEPE